MTIFFNEYYKLYTFLKNNILKEHLLKNWEFDSRSSLSEIVMKDWSYWIKQTFTINEKEYTFLIEYIIVSHLYLITCESENINFSICYKLWKEERYELDQEDDLDDINKYWKFWKSIRQIFILKNNEQRDYENE